MHCHAARVFTYFQFRINLHLLLILSNLFACVVDVSLHTSKERESKIYVGWVVKML